jgi:hypothetical protein
MGVGAIFSMEARAQLEAGTSLPLGKPKRPMEPFTEMEMAIWLVWPVGCYVVLGSTWVEYGY